MMPAQQYRSALRWLKGTKVGQGSLPQIFDLSCDPADQKAHQGQLLRRPLATHITNCPKNSTFQTAMDSGTEIKTDACNKEPAVNEEFPKSSTFRNCSPAAPAKSSREKCKVQAVAGPTV
jgi:hypothetical protein